MQGTNYQNISCQLNYPLAVVSIEREKEQNTLNMATISELTEVFKLLGQDINVRAIILTGSGSEAFSAGVDVGELTGLSAMDAKHYAEQGQASMCQLEQLGKPVIAAINGMAMGAGLELALACTLRLAVEDTKLAHPAIKMGFIPCGTQRLIRLIGMGRALTMLLMEEFITAKEAYQWGLINGLTSADELPVAAYALAQKLSHLPALAIKYCLEMAITGYEMPLEDNLFLEATLSGLCASRDEMQKRPPFLLG